MTMPSARLAPLAALAAVLALPFRAQAQPSSDSTAFGAAALAWERGEYPLALRTMTRLLQSPGGERHRAAIALLTGERYRTDSLAPDGRALRVSADGRYASWETGTGAATVTQVVRLDPAGTVTPVTTLRAGGVVLAPSGGRVAYLRVDEDAELAAARAELARVAGGGNRDAMRPAMQRVQELEGRLARVVVHDLASGAETVLPDGALVTRALAYAPDMRAMYVLARPASGTDTTLYVVRGGGASAPEPLGRGRVVGSELTVAPGGAHVVVSGSAAGRTPSFSVVNTATGEVRTIAGLQPSVSGDGSTLAYLVRDGREFSIRLLSLRADGEPVVVKRTTDSLETPALSPDGRRVAFSAMPSQDWELFVIDASGDSASERRLTRELQHDRFPRWVDGATLLSARGEGRHRRSSLYDVATGRATRMFHNNSVRTIAPEYEWVPTPDGARVLVVAERDGNTVSPERGVYVVHLKREVTTAQLQERLRQQLDAEEALRERARRMYEPIRAAVKQATDSVSIERLYGYQKALFDFGSKHITRPGNLPARQWLLNAYRSFGYDARFQEFTPRTAPLTANVIATLRGTENPELIYVVGSHFDSRAEGPGADDNTSGTAMLLETARVLAKTPLPATVMFVSFTGEEGGLLGSREFARVGTAEKLRVMAALNNDMMGWSGDHRLDNTIRYANPGIRDVQHGGALGFSKLITYDALYYKSTDAHALYDAWGDVIGGFGSYPVLGNPHYHQPHDVLETINQELMVETTRANVASVMLLASSPSRVAGLMATRAGAGATLRWTPSPEKGVRSYRVAYGPAEDPLRTVVTVTEPTARIATLPAGSVVSVKAVNARGLEGWDWARVEVQ
jgi:hypothetical protein